LRREQYTLRDSYQQTILTQDSLTPYYPTDDPALDVDIEVLPLGIKQDYGVGACIFRNWHDITPDAYSEKELKKISKLYWKKKGYCPNP
jgi:hypothetical protein